MANEPISIDRTSVEFNDLPSKIDPSFFSDVPRIPVKISHAVVHLIESEVDRLFDFCPPKEWATFHPFRDYWTHLKRLFSQKVLSSFEPDFVIETLDNLHENGTVPENTDGEKLYAMLNTLTNLNEILQDIYLRILATFKP